MFTFNLIELHLPSLAFKREPMTPKHAVIGCQTWHDWSSNIWSLADHGANLALTYVSICICLSRKWFYFWYNHEILVGARLSEPFRLRKFMLQSAKLQMFDDQSYHAWHPIRACFGVTCSCLDASDSNAKNAWINNADQLSSQPVCGIHIGNISASRLGWFVTRYRAVNQEGTLTSSHNIKPSFLRQYLFLFQFFVSEIRDYSSTNTLTHKSKFEENCWSEGIW